MKKWQCSVCKYIHSEDKLPEKCPVCGVPESKFVPYQEDDAAQAAPEKETIAEKKVADKAEAPRATALEDQSRAKVYMEQAKVYMGRAMEFSKVYMEKAAVLMLKHHAHPVTVHLPNGVIPVVAALFLISWISGSILLGQAGFINLVFVIIGLPVVIISGVLEWKRKYNQAMTTIFKVKIGAAALATICCIISIAWYLMNPNVLQSSSAFVFVALNLLMLVAVGIAGHIGGKLIFKD